MLPLATLLALAPAGDVAPADEPATQIRAIILVAGPLSYRELEDALRIRLPRLRTLPFERRSFDDLGDEAYAYVELTRPSAPPGAIDISVILTDGRSYGRRFVPDAEDPVRDTATVLANTIAAIEEERLEPTRADAEIPEPLEAVAPVEPDAPQEPTPPVEPAAPRWSIGLAPSFGAVVGLAPQPTGVFGGGSVGLDLLARAPIGVAMILGARVTTRDTDVDVRVSRIRVMLGAGWAHRHRSFEVLAVGAFTVEPWLLSSGSGQRPIVGPEDPVGPLLGGLARVSPGVFLEPRRTPSFALRLGLFAELAGSALPGAGAPRLVVDDGASEPHEIARLGGLELATGADVTFWFMVPRRR